MADLVIHGNLVNVYSGEVYEAYVGLQGPRVKYVHRHSKRGGKYLDVYPRYILPGLIDAHIHIESSMLTPTRFAEAAVPRGTTCVICDPHEIANVLGIDGVRYMIKTSSKTPLRFYYMIPSCVPASKLETTGGIIGIRETTELKNEPGVLGLGEVMNFPGVVGGDKELMSKIALFRDMAVDGHSPGLRGEELCKYVSAGISSDHECTDKDEALEKLSLGMRIMIREGTASKDMHRLIGAVNEANSRRFMMVSDDLGPDDLVKNGHVDRLLRRAVEEGLDPVNAVRLVTSNPAEYFGLKLLGGVAPGKLGDLVVVEDLESFRVSMVLINGRLVAKDGKALFPQKTASRIGSPMNFTLSPGSLAIGSPSPEAKVRVIEVYDGSLYTSEKVIKMRPKNGFIASSPDRDILKVCVVERYRSTGNVGVGFVRGFGLKRGALASSIAHDSHNIVAVGVRDKDIHRAGNAIKKLGGGIAAVGDSISALSLPVAGLMTDDLPERVAENLVEVNRVAEDLGCPLSSPFSTLSFIALAVIPELKLTDMGLVDVRQSKLVNLIVQK